MGRCGNFLILRAKLTLMATAAFSAGVVGGNGSSSSWTKLRGKDKKQRNKTRMTNNNKVKFHCSSSYVMDPYKTLKIQPGASESEVKKAFRQLALQVINFILNLNLNLNSINFRFVSLDSGFSIQINVDFDGLCLIDCVNCSIIQMYAEGTIVGCSFTKSMRLTMYVLFLLRNLIYFF